MYHCTICNFRNLMQEVTINKQTRLSEHLASPSEATFGQTSELDGSHLSPHFSLGELTKTSARTADGNIPSHAHIENLRRLCRWLEMLRSRWNMMYGEGNDPLIINSGYRSPQVNKAVGRCSHLEPPYRLRRRHPGIRSGATHPLRRHPARHQRRDPRGLRRTPAGAFASRHLLAPLRRAAKGQQA